MTGAKQTNVFNHLRVLREAGIVEPAGAVTPTTGSAGGPGAPVRTARRARRGCPHGRRYGDYATSASGHRRVGWYVAFLVAAVIGSGIAAQRLSPDDIGLQLLVNSVATGAALVALTSPSSGCRRRSTRW